MQKEKNVTNYLFNALSYGGCSEPVSGGENLLKSIYINHSIKSIYYERKH